MFSIWESRRLAARKLENSNQTARFVYELLYQIVSCYNLLMTTIFRSGTDIEADKASCDIVLAVDLGFARSSNTSCGVVLSQGGKIEEPQTVSFGNCINYVVKVIQNNKKVVLIIEAPLSGVFDEAMNPLSRGDFENKSTNPNIKTSRHWYTGAGASICLGAIFFLRMLHDKLQAVKGEEDLEVVLYEGFVTFKEKSVSKKAKQLSHGEDAELLMKCFLGQHRREIENVDLVVGGTATILSDIVTQSRNSQTPLIIVPIKSTF